MRKNELYAVIGASNNSAKYGYKVFAHLKQAGYKVVPINKKEDKIQGDKAYPILEKVPRVPDVLVFVVPPKATEEIVIAAEKLGIKKIWMQPGSESSKAIKYCVDHGMEVVHDRCIMVEGH